MLRYWQRIVRFNKEYQVDTSPLRLERFSLKGKILIIIFTGMTSPILQLNNFWITKRSIIKSQISQNTENVIKDLILIA